MSDSHKESLIRKRDSVVKAIWEDVAKTREYREIMSRVFRRLDVRLDANSDETPNSAIISQFLTDLLEDESVPGAEELIQMFRKLLSQRIRDLKEGQRRRAEVRERARRERHSRSRSSRDAPTGERRPYTFSRRDSFESNFRHEERGLRRGSQFGEDDSASYPRRRRRRGGRGRRRELHFNDSHTRAPYHYHS